MEQKDNNTDTDIKYHIASFIDVCAGNGSKINKAGGSGRTRYTIYPVSWNK